MSSPTPNDLTRQQLDELDLLLQRMLSLPLTTPGEPTAAPFAPPPMPDLPAVANRSWRADPPAVPKIPHLIEAAARQPVFASVGVALAEPEQDSSPTAEEDYPTPSPTWDPVPIIRTMPSEPEEPRYPAPDESAKLSQPVESHDLLVETTGTLRGVDAPAVPFGFRSPFADDTPVPLDPTPDAPIPAPLPLEVPTASAPSVPLLFWPLFAVNWLIEALFCVVGGSAVTKPVPKYLLGVVGVVLLAAAGAWSARGMGWVTFPLPR